MKYYVISPDLTPYEGVVVDENTDIVFESELVKQSVKDLKLVSEYTFKNEKFVSTTKTIINLDKGEVLLFEKENRGYFLPKDSICTLENAIEDYKTLALALDGDENDAKRDENKDI